MGNYKWRIKFNQRGDNETYVFTGTREEFEATYPNAKVISTEPAPVWNPEKKEYEYPSDTAGDYIMDHLKEKTNKEKDN